MSNNLLAEQFYLHTGQTGQNEPVSSKVDSSALSLSIGMVGTVSNNLLPHQPSVVHGATPNNLGLQNSLLPAKRKTPVEHMPSNLLPHQQSFIRNKPVTQRESLVGASRPTNKKTVQISSTPGTNGSLNLPNKKMARNESIPKYGTQRVQTPKNRTQPMEPSPKARAESFEAVRSKMRESLAAALALVSQDQENNKKDSPHDLPSGKGESTASEIINLEQEPQLNPILPDGDSSFSESLFVKDELLQGNGLCWAWDMDMVAAEAKEIKTLENESLVHVDLAKIVRSPDDLANKIESELFKLYGGVNKKYKEKGRSLLFNLKDRSNPELRERVMSGDITPDRLCSMTAEELASKELSEWRVAKAQELAEMIVLPDTGIDPRRLVKKTHKGEYQVEFEHDDVASVDLSAGSSVTQVRPKDDNNNNNNNGNKRAKKEVFRKESLRTEDISCSLTIPSDGADLMQGLIVDELKDTEFLPPIVSLDEFMESLDSEPPFEIISVDSGKTESPSNKEKSQVDDDGGTNNPYTMESDEGKIENLEKIEPKEQELEVKSKSDASPVDRKHSPPAGKILIAERVWEGVLQLNISCHVAVTGFFRSGEKASTTEWPNSLEIKGRVRLDAFEKFLQELPMSRSRAVMVAHFILKDSTSESERSSFNELVDSYVSDERLGFAEPATGIEVYICPTHEKILDLLTKRLLKDQTEILESSDNGLIGIVVWRKPHFTSSVKSPNSSHHHHKHASRKQLNAPSTRNVNVKSNLKSSSSLGQRYVNPKGPNRHDDDEDDIPPGFGPGSAKEEEDLPEFNFSGNSNSSGHQTHGGSRMSHLQPAKPVDQMRELIQRYGQTNTLKLPVNPPLPEKRGWNKDDDDDIPEWDPQAHGQPPPQQLRQQGFQQGLVGQFVHSGVPVQNPVSQMYPQNNVATQSWPQGSTWSGQMQGSIGDQQPIVGQQFGVPGATRADLAATDLGRGVPRSRGY
jgi:hypothetical protein